MQQLELLKKRRKKIAVVGLGYVGLPLALAFDEVFDVIGFDLNEIKISNYLSGKDLTNEVGDEAVVNSEIKFTANPKELKNACFVVVAVPTPVNIDKTPDLSPVINASRIIGENMAKGTIVVFESTVYPGVTEEVCAHELERASGLVCGRDFYIGYSPERINPGDTVHNLRNIVKIVSGMNEEVRDALAEIYGQIINENTGGAIYPAESIRVAEAAKLVENSQRDINIAFMNELALAFHKMGINTIDVINAMNTKWNALGFFPGLVGGHCIGVDPYYFIYDAEKYGYHSSIISAGRRINDDMPEIIAREIVRELLLCKQNTHEAEIYMLGMTFKGNCADLRNTKAGIVKKELESYGLNIKICDPQAIQEEMITEFGQKPVLLQNIKKADCLIFTADHKEFKELTPEDVSGMIRPNGCRLVVDIRNIFNRKEIERQGLRYWSL